VSVFTNGILEPFTTILLICLAGMTSFLTAALGAGGGLLLLVVMASILPMAVIIKDLHPNYFNVIYIRD